MIVEFCILSSLCSEKLTVYSCYLGDNEYTEFEDFNEKANRFEGGHLKEIYLIKEILAKMKNKGAKEFYFKEERNAHALPKLTEAQIQLFDNPDFGIRLYCIRLRDDVLILLNGGIKTTQNPEDCPNVRAHFRRVVQIATKIDKAIIQKEINLNKKDSLSELIFEL